MLNDSKVTANVPAADLDRARNFYADKLGLVASAENPGGLIYKTSGGTTFFLYQTEYAGQAGHTIAQFHVDDVEEQVRDLTAKGVKFEHYDMPDTKLEGDLHVMGDMKVAWFKDPDGNILNLING